MDEQRILEEMERVLAADDPKLAARLAAFGQPGIGHVLRTRRARATLSLMVLVLIAAVASVIYMMTAFRLGAAANNSRPTVRTSQHTVLVTPKISPKGCRSFDPSCGLYPQFERPGYHPARTVAHAG